MRWCFLLVSLVILSISAAGWSSSGAAAVEGQVTYGGEPIDVGSIAFIPKSEGGTKTGGLIDKGAYHIDAKIGPTPGTHRVEIRWAKPTGAKKKNEFGEEIQTRREGLPEKYHDQSTLAAEVKAGKNVINFELEK